MAQKEKNSQQSRKDLFDIRSFVHFIWLELMDFFMFSNSFRQFDLQELFYSSWYPCGFFVSLLFLHSIILFVLNSSLSSLALLNFYTENQSKSRITEKSLFNFLLICLSLSVLPIVTIIPMQRKCLERKSSEYEMECELVNRLWAYLQVHMRSVLPLQAILDTCLYCAFSKEFKRNFFCFLRRTNRVG